MFYDRFDDGNLLNAQRYNGTTQQSYQITASPSVPLSYYPGIPPLTALSTGLTQQNIYRIDPTVQAPYLMQSAASVERALPAHTSLSVNFVIRGACISCARAT